MWINFFKPYSKEENTGSLPFVNMGKIYYNICPSNRIAYETQKAWIKEEGREKERESGIEEIHIQ